MKNEWWHPISVEDGGRDWLCDHLGDAHPVMVKMWDRLCELDPTLPKEGWPPEDEKSTGEPK
jgi:hypothetical protein